MVASRTKKVHEKYQSTTHYVLSSLVPYTEANLKLSFRPGAFFNDLEKLSEHKKKASSIRMGYYRAVKQGLVRLDDDGSPKLTEQGKARLRRYEPSKLKGSASVLVIFDIPETDRWLRQRLRGLLRELRFVQIQKSVWQSEYDVVEHLVEGLRNGNMTGYVQVHESVRIN